MAHKLLATLRGLAAVVLMLFATNFAPVASTLVGSASADSADITWGQQGRDQADPNCLEGQTANFHFVLAPAGTKINDAGTINVTFSPSGSDSDTGIVHANGAGSYNVSGAFNAVADAATVTGADWTAPAKHPDKQPMLVLSSSSCTGTPTTVVDVCANIDGIQTEVPEGKILVDGNCVTPPTDVCANIDGVQTVVPEGKVLVDGNCVTPPTDVCANIQGVQTVVPEGMVKDGDDCVTPPTDVCKNIPGIQTEVPEGKVLVDGKCKNVKVFVCKYVGKPGVDERLKRGKNPISVSVNATGGTAVGSYFNDAQGRSFVLGIDDGEFNPTVEDCPAPQGPVSVTPVVQFSEPTCENTFGRVTVTAMNGVTYKVNGNVITGTTSYAAGSAVTVTVTLASGLVLANGASATFNHTFSAAPTGCVLGATDVCPNISGDQATVPAGMTKDVLTGNCVTNVGRGGDVLGASTTAQLANTGESPWASVIIGLTVISLTLTSAFVSRRQRLDA